MTSKRKYPYGPIDERELAAFEGGLPALSGLHGGPLHLRLERAREGFAGAVPDSLLVIGAGPFGNYFAMDLAGDLRTEELAYPRTHG